ncbi:MAG: PAS domain S-box protein [bacterium]|nr:PAS domain S-box protein [bacterium]
MKFYYDRFKDIRKKQKMTMVDFAVKANITRRTLWSWENDRLTPSEKKIRKLANILNVQVSKISDLKDEHPSASGVIPHMIMDSWLSLASYNEKMRQKNFEEFLDRMKSFNIELTQAAVVIKALLNSINIIFYIKDKNQKYIAASKSFLKMYSLSDDYRILGKEDHNFLNLKDAKKNTFEDEKVLFTGHAVKNKEAVIPGTKRKRYGVISKTPILNSENKIVGLVGTFIDITKRKKEEYKREILELNLNTVPLAVSLVKCSNNKYLYLNQAHENIYGYSNDKFYRGGHKFWFSCVHETEREKILRKSEGRYWITAGIYVITKPDKQERIVEVTRSHITYNDEDYWIAITEDITEKKKNEKEMIFLAKLDIAEKLKSKGVGAEVIYETTGLKVD